ncbi:MAG TPA: beta-L-arabinofuranosidase domain-containing protein [Gryllotalpicola sp.]
MQTVVSETRGPVALSAFSRVTVAPLVRGAVSFTPEGFLGSWQTLNTNKTIPHCIDQLEASGVIDNFRRVTGESDAPFRGFPFADSDAYKVLEAIAWEVGRTGTTDYDEFTDFMIGLIARVQADDGYINTWVQGGESPDRPLTAMRWSHELYCLGHLIQAAVAFSRAAGRRDLLELTIRYVDLVERELGFEGRGDVDGHPEIETALIELWRETNEQRFLALAGRFIDERGHKTVGQDRLGYEYFLDHEPIREVTEATGHAVRQLYLAAGAADLEIEQPDPALEGALQRIWDSVHHQKMYITGGLGSRHRDESFGDPYELPPDRAYSETCAAIANFMWNWRMLLRSGQSRFADEMERGLYNAIAASTALSGTEFFYANPLQLREGHRSEENAPAGRTSWYSCACCPPNLARLIASIDTYAATRDERGVQVHLYGSASIALTDGPDAPRALVRTDYPWDGRVAVSLDQPLPVELRLRVPGWTTGYTVLVDGAPAHPTVEGGYLVFPARSVVHSVELDLDLRPVIEHPHPRLDASRGAVAVRRGPIVYCLEQDDLPEGVHAQDVYLPETAALEVAPAPEGLDTPALSARGAAVRDSSDCPIYSTDPGLPAERELDAVTLVPYFRWGNRRQAAMRVWIPTR